MNRRAYNAIDRSGQKVHSWTIISFSHTKNKKAHYLCRCDCGKEVIKEVNRILRGYSNSCGCRNIKNHITHGLSNSRVYNIWQNMKNRCTNPKTDKFKWYGGRGISVCERWLNSFDLFFLDMGSPPSDKHSIDRVNNDGNYEPGNCRWATMKEQSNNRRLPNPPQQ